MNSFEPDDTRDALRKIGGLLFGLACLMIFVRKNGGPGHWARFPMFLDVLIPAVLLYGMGVATRVESGGLRVWQTVYAVFGLLLIPLVFREFVLLVGGSPGSSFNTFWIFGATAALAYYAGFVGGVRVQLLLGSIALIISWTALWNGLMSGGITHNWGLFRGLLGILAIGLLAAGLYVWRANPGGDAAASDSALGPGGDLGLWKASELLTGAGIAAVSATAVGGVVSYAALAFGPTVSTLVHSSVHTTVLWDVLLLLVSLGSVAIGSRIGTRGPVYIGGIGLALFVLIAGTDLHDNPPHPTHFGVWPWILLVLGLGGIGLSFSKEASLGDQPRKFIENLRGR